MYQYKKKHCSYTVLKFYIVCFLNFFQQIFNFHISGTMLYICIYISSELLLVALILNVSALLNLLKIDLENVTQPSNSLTTYQEDDICDNIKDIVILHQKLLRSSYHLLVKFQLSLKLASEFKIILAEIGAALWFEYE